MKKYQSFLTDFFSVLGGKIFYIFELACFRNEAPPLASRRNWRAIQSRVMSFNQLVDNEDLLRRDIF